MNSIHFRLKNSRDVTSPITSLIQPSNCSSTQPFEESVLQKYVRRLICFSADHSSIRARISTVSFLFSTFASLAVCSGQLVTTSPPSEQVKPPSTNATSEQVSFATASIRKSDPNATTFEFFYVPDGLSVLNVSIRTLIAAAYGIEADQLQGGPSWLDSSKFDIEARIEPDDPLSNQILNSSKRGLLLQALLKERFKLRTHHEAKLATVYALRVAKKGTIIHGFQSTPSGVTGGHATSPLGSGSLFSQPGKLSAMEVSMSSIAHQLSTDLGSAVVDETQLPGEFTFELHWDLDGGSRPEASVSGSEQVSILVASLDNALRDQVGLRLERSKEVVDTLIVDSVDTPTPN